MKKKIALILSLLSVMGTMTGCSIKEKVNDNVMSTIESSESVERFVEDSVIEEATESVDISSLWCISQGFLSVNTDDTGLLLASSTSDYNIRVKGLDLVQALYESYGYDIWFVPEIVLDEQGAVLLIENDILSTMSARAIAQGTYFELSEELGALDLDDTAYKKELYNRLKKLFSDEEFAEIEQRSKDNISCYFVKSLKFYNKDGEPLGIETIADLQDYIEQQKKVM